MATGTIIKLKRKSGAFKGGELAAGEMAIDILNHQVCFSVDGITVDTMESATFIPEADLLRDELHDTKFYHNSYGGEMTFDGIFILK